MNILELQEFFIEGKDHLQSHVLLHIAEPVSSDERAKGYFFVVAEITNGYEEQIESLQQIIDEIESQYYNSGTKNASRAFEEVLQDSNRRGHHILQYDDTEIHCVIGTLRDKNISLAYHGRPVAELFYPQKDHLSRTTIIEVQADDSRQLFSELIEGSMNPGDYVFISTPKVMDFFTFDRIRKILEAKNTRHSAAHIQKILHDLDSDASFGGILTHITDKHDAPKTGKLPRTQGQGSEASLNQLIGAAKKTEETLSPPLLGNLSGGFSQLLKKKSAQKQAPQQSARQEAVAEPPEERKHTHYRVETNYRREREQKSESLTSKLLLGLGQALIVLGKGIALLGIKLYGLIAGILRGSFFLLTNKNDGRKKTLRSVKSTVEHQKNFFLHLPKLSKILLLAVVVLALVFVSSISYLRFKENAEARAAAYNNLVQAIEDKKDAAEAALVYEETNRALSLLQDAERLLGELSTHNDEQAEAKQALETAVTNLLATLRNLEMVEPETVLDLTALAENPAVDRMIMAGETLLLFGEKDAQYYTHSLLTGNSAEAPLHTITQITAADFDEESNTVVVLGADQRLARIDLTTNGITPLSFSSPEEANVGAIVVYNETLYTLENNRGTIYKHKQTQTGFDKGTEWLQDSSISLKNGVDLGIDGHIYTVDTDGTITKLFRGQKQAFELTNLDPPLTSARELIVEPENNRILVLDSVNKRIVAMDKDGTFLKQYTASVWQAPKSMALNRGQGILYVLDGTTVYRFSL